MPGLVIWGNRKSGHRWVAWARATGPPRSNSQYHRPKMITFVSQSIAPVVSSDDAKSPSVPRASPTTRWPTDQALARLRTPTKERASQRST